MLERGGELVVDEVLDRVDVEDSKFDEKDGKGSTELDDITIVVLGLKLVGVR